MNIFMLLSLIGGLALFLYGMDTMSAGLAKLTGGKLQKILQSLTSNKWKACALGAVVTAIIQSSSATTVMVVGMVNSGILKLTQVAGIIFGANIGTTATSWILSLSGLRGESFFVQLFKPTTFSPILGIVGVILIMAGNKPFKKDIGRIMIGFAILMFGMNAMSDAVEPLGEIPEFAQIMTLFSNPILGVLMGAVVTAVIQSSSASVGILQALSMTGSLSYASTIPIILGQNIGTCATSLISSLGTNKNAKAAAFIHLYFNIIGTVLFLAAYLFALAFLDMQFLGSVTTPVGIAVIHSIFNVVSTVILMPFAEKITDLATFTVYGKEPIPEMEDSTLNKLDPLFLSNPSFAVQQARQVANEMGKKCYNALVMSYDLIQNYNPGVHEEIIRIEQKVDNYEDHLGSYLVKLSALELSESDNRIITIIMNSISDWERISDHVATISDNCKDKHDNHGIFSSAALAEMKVYQEALTDIMNKTVTAFETMDLNLASEIEPLEEVIDKINSKVKKKHVKRLQKGICSIDMGLILMNIATSYERISDHCSNIGASMIEIMEDDYETHQYLTDIREDEHYKNLVKEYRKKYQLPAKKAV